ncbi:MAG: RsmB/NOP family class I SAM-dependent RNA methyltransferase [Shimia sp.]
MSQTDPARRAAAALMQGVLSEGQSLAELAEVTAKLDPPVRARAERLANEAFRQLDRADRHLKPFLKKPPPLAALNLLRLATVELVIFGEAPHGVVNAYVTLAASDRTTAGFKGLINAVLRKVTPEGWEKLPTPQLPKWLRKPLVEAWGNPTVQRMEVAHAKGAPLDLTVKADAAHWAEALGAAILVTGSLRLTGAHQVSALPGFEDGAWWVQDAAAALPVRILDPQPGERIADLCAAPGGKTMQLAAAGAHVTAVDDNPKRMERVARNLARTKLTAELRVESVMAHAGRYDAVLLDAPCSATGTIRRHPDLPFAKDGTGISQLIALQAQMIDAAVAMLKPGGRMVFCTCSLIPDEGEVQVEDALNRHPDLTVDRAALERPGIDPDWITEEGGLRLRPDMWKAEGGLDGFYIAALRRAPARDGV